MSPPRRKKWSETEEKTLIDKYGRMVLDGILAKMKTREKKFRPIALYVNCSHHERDPVAYPWQWTWKDVSTKVQNMRHQYLLVKQKIKKPELSIGDDYGSGRVEFDWPEGVSYWSNFLRYKEVFGDVPLTNDPVLGPPRNDENSHDFDGGSHHGLELVMFGNFEQSRDGEEREENFNVSSDHLKDDGDDGLVYEEVEASGKESKGLEKKAWGFVASQVRQLREMQACFEKREVERDRERQKRERLSLGSEKRMEQVEKTRKRLRGQWMEEWGAAMDKESQEKESRQRREERLIREREWEERMNRRRSEWAKRMDEMLSQHRAEMGQLQSRIFNEQQSLVSQLVGVVSQWSSHTEHTSTTNPYLSQMMHNLQHVNGMVHDDTKVGDCQDD